MEIKFCEVDGCEELAVGISRWDRDRKPESRFCRPDYLEGAELVQYEVIGPHEVTDALTNGDVGKGGIVTLDTLQTNVAQLIYAGHVKAVQSSAKKAAPKTTAASTAEPKQD